MGVCSSTEQRLLQVSFILIVLFVVLAARSANHIISCLVQLQPGLVCCVTYDDDIQVFSYCFCKLMNTAARCSTLKHHWRLFFIEGRTGDWRGTWGRENVVVGVSLCLSLPASTGLYSTVELGCLPASSAGTSQSVSPGKCQMSANYYDTIGLTLKYSSCIIISLKY